MKNTFKKPCKDCPFLKNSLPNYLGGRWSASELHQFVMSEQSFACHNTIEEEGQKKESVEHCVGSIMYMNKSAKMCGDKELFKLQKKFKSENHDNVMDLVEFHEHHKYAEKKY